MVKRAKSPPDNNLLLSIKYSEYLPDWERWENKADELLKAAELFEPHITEYWNIVTKDFKDGKYNDPLKTPSKTPFNPQSAYFMLVAYALENLLKAIIIKKRQNEFLHRLIRNLPVVVKTHNLIDLSKKANISVTFAEEDLLHRLCRQSTWAGRYPIPVEASSFKSIEQYSDGQSHLTALFSSGDVDRVIKLVKRVKTIISDESNTA